MIHAGDVANEEYVKRLVDATLRKFGTIDVLINNAGTADFGPFEKTTTQSWRKILGVNLDAVFSTLREALPHLQKAEVAL